MYILKHEGGYVFDSNDPGGETKFGISKRSYPNCDVKNLTEEKAKNIYKFDYWDSVKADSLKPAIRLLVFDCAVNQGVGTATKLMQKIAGVKQDGIFGPITNEAVSQLDDMDFIDKYSQARLERYTALPQWKFFGKGWAKRLLEISLLCAFFADLKLS